MVQQVEEVSSELQVARLSLSGFNEMYALWGPDSRELFYVATDRKLMTVSLKQQRQKGRFVLEHWLPKALFDTGDKIHHLSSFIPKIRGPSAVISSKR
jgi:hypothetical protein